MSQYLIAHIGHTNREQHDEDMAAELREKVNTAINSGVPVLVGDYSAKS